VIDKFLQHPQMAPVASPQAIAEVVQQVLAPRDAQLQEIVNAIIGRLTQLEQSMQPKKSPFDIALQALPHCSDQATPGSTEARCYDKAFDVIERWLDASIQATQGGSGQPGADAGESPGAEAAPAGADQGDRSEALGDQARQAPAEND
jgi:hypothetical protein